MTHDAIVVGAGAVGLTIARSLASERSVLLIERGRAGREASWAAAGMLCPHSESVGDNAFARLGLAALEMYRGFVDELRSETGIDAEYRDEGTLMVASTEEEWAGLQKRFDWQTKAGLDTRLLDPDAIASLEPQLSLELRGGLFCPGDHQVRPRRLVDALLASCRLRGVTLEEGTRVDRLVTEGGRVLGVEADGRRIEAPVVVVAAGAWASGIDGLRPVIETRPRKGQILSLEMSQPPLFRHVIRWGRLYLVPRADGELVVGATNEDCGFDRRLSAGGIGDLLAAAARMSSRVRSLALRETWTGLRPFVGDGMPVIGPAGVGGLYYALGHYRNGILLAPLTGAVIATLVDGGEAEVAESFSPARSSGYARSLP